MTTKKEQQQRFTKAEHLENLRAKAADALIEWLDDSNAKEFNDYSDDSENAVMSNAYAFGYNDARAEAMRILANFVLRGVNNWSYDDDDDCDCDDDEY